MRAVGDVRVGKVGGRGSDSFLSPDLQHEQIAAAARREGPDVVEVLEELDDSAATRRGRSRTGRSAAWRTARSGPSSCGT